MLQTWDLAEHKIHVCSQGNTSMVIEASSEESDSEMVAGREERAGSTRINMTDTRIDVRSGGDIRSDRMATGDSVGSQKSSPETMERLGTSKFSTRIQRVENPSIKYGCQDYVTVERAVHRLVVILPADYNDK